MSKAIIDSLEPMPGFVFVKRDGKADKSAGGVLLPDIAKTKAPKPLKGRVLAVGLGERLKSGARAEVEVRVGEMVLFGRHAGHEVEFEGEAFLAVHMDDLLGVDLDG